METFSRLRSGSVGSGFAAAQEMRSSISWVTASSRSARSRSSFAICCSRTARLATFSTSSSSSWSTVNLLTPITGWRPESMRAWVRAAASSMRIFGMPCSMALAMPPACSTSWILSQPFRASCSVSFST